MTNLRVPFTRSPRQVVLLAKGEQHPFVKPGYTPEQLQQLFSGLAMAISELEEKQRQSLQEMQHVAIELAAAAASWLTMAAIDRNQFHIEQLIADSVMQLRGNGPLTVRLNPEDFDQFNTLKETHAEPNSTLKDVQFVPDPTMARGSCRTESDSISLVSDLETRLASVRQAWLETLDDAQTERRATGDRAWEPGRVPDRRETA
jgi:flagellar biosynthesis/type III secretory pathway protein FliH